MTINKTKILRFILLFLGFFAPIGVQFNTYLSFASLIYPSLIACLFLILILFGYRLYDKKSLSNWLSIFILFTLFHNLIMLILGYFNIIVFEDSINEILNQYLKYTLYFLAIFVYSNLFRRNALFLNSFMIGYIVSFGIVILVSSSNYIITDGVIRNLGAYNDPNSMALDAIISLAFCAYLMTRTNILLKKSIVLIFAIISIYAIITSGSRGAIFGVLVGFAFSVIMIRNYKKKFSILLIATIAAIVMLSYFYYSDNTTLQRILFGTSDSNSISGNIRIQIWSDYLSQIKAYFWIGIGKSREYLLHYYQPHNTLLDSFVTYGVLGFILFFGALFITFKKGIMYLLTHNDYSKVILFSLFLSVIVSVMFISSFNMRSLPIAFSIMYGKYLWR